MCVLGCYINYFFKSWLQQFENNLLRINTAIPASLLLGKRVNNLKGNGDITQYIKVAVSF